MRNLLKQQIEWTLRDYKETRNSDIALTIRVWKTFYPQQIHAITPGHEAVWLRDLYDLPREDNVKRLRAKLNSEGKYLPTDWKVAKARGIQEDQWRTALGYPPVGQTVLPTRPASPATVMRRNEKEIGVDNTPERQGKIEL